MEEVRIGFIGCGGNASGHMRQLSSLEGVRIVATCDVQEDRAQSAAESYNAEPYTNHKVMLERDDLDAVYLSLPVFAHGQPELDVIERRLPFLVEKPVAINMELAQQIEVAVADAGIITCVGYQLRYLGSTQLARNLLNGEDINMVVGKYWSGSGRGDAGSWVRQMSRSGGQLVEQATHTVDMMRYLVGEVEEVYALQTNRILKGIDCPDNNCVTMTFTNGAIGSLTASWSYDLADWSHANVLDILYEDQLIHWDASSLQVREEGQVVTKKVPGPGIDEVFVDAVRNGDDSRILSPYRDAVKSLAISLAANRSGREGIPVKL
ncbi:MAG: Gfo/Idh/MocA family oxidoreductase [Candidatus Poribacteria bacterium]|nr:Gfo/Idh/MocA family oxidoreductase [Candidatus Poribacteria bacterium]